MKNFFLVLLMLFVTSITYSQTAQRVTVKRILFRTNQVILSAQSSVKRNQHFTGEFSKSYAHQCLAIKYFRSGRMEKSIFHSLKGRKDAVKSIRDNRGKTPREATFDSNENSYVSSLPSINVLEKELLSSGVAVVKEDSLSTTKLDLSIE